MGIVATVLPPLAALSIAAGLLVPGSALAQNAECGVPLSSTPIGHAGETTIFTGVDHDDRAFALTRNPETGAWALWVISEFTEQSGGVAIGKPCIVVAGAESRMLIDAPPPEILTEASGTEVAAGDTPASTDPDAETYRVTRIDSGEVLDLRTGAGTDFPSIAEMPPHATGISVGACKSVDGYRFPWCEASWDGKQGWASACCLEGERTGRRLE